MSDARSYPAWRLLSPTEGALVDRSVRKALIRSLTMLFAKAADRMKYDEAKLQILLDKIDAGPVKPAIFGLYTELVEALFRGDSRISLEDLAQYLIGLDPAGAGTSLVSLTDQDLGASQAARYARLIKDDPHHTYGIQPLVENFAEAHARVSAALSVLHQGAPELAREITALVREIVLVADAQDNSSRSFDGASTFYLWGAVFLNVGDATRLDLAQQIAHEAAHLLLFGLMMGQPLTENDLEERFTSPLRQDPRPMEGVVHAAYVLARMSYALRRLLESGSLAPADQVEAQEKLVLHRTRFFDTLPTIQRHARFKPEAHAVFQGAVEYMSRDIGQVADTR